VFVLIFISLNFKNNFMSFEKPVELPIHPPYNPDRVQTEVSQETIKTIVPPKNRYETVTTERFIEQNPSWSVRFFSATERVKAVVLATTAGMVIGGVSTNIGNEHTSGDSNKKLTDTESIGKSLETVDVKTVVQETEKEVCHIVDVDFMHRFTTKDANGNEAFNPGAVVIPFAVELKEHCKAKVDVELHVPYHFSRTFSEIIAKNPESRDEMVKKLAQFITSEAQNQLVIKGIAGVTDTTFVYNKKENILVSGKPVVDLGNFDVSDIKLAGSASAEAEKSIQHQEEKSLKGFNPENLHLAQKRLEDMRPLIIEAFQKSGVSASVLAGVKDFSYEHNLVDAEIKELAQISKDILGDVVSGSDQEVAYMLVEEINKGNPAVISAINANPHYAEVLERDLFSARSVNVSFEAKTEYDKTTVYNAPVPLPVALFLLPGIKITRTPGEIKIVNEEKRIRIPDTIKEELVTNIEPKTRRLFSETTPRVLDKPRSFDDVYDAIDLSERAEDTHNLLQHMLIEEVSPSLDELTKEPLIDYEEIVNACRRFLSSDTREGGVKKGHYDTPKDAQRKMTEMLLEMWERHDVTTYPMQGIDLKKVLNYRDSEQIVYWAKTLASSLVDLAQETDTTDELREKLLEKIREASNTRTAQRGSDRNIFVQSAFPQESI